MMAPNPNGLLSAERCKQRLGIANTHTKKHRHHKTTHVFCSWDAQKTHVAPRKVPQVAPPDASAFERCQDRPAVAVRGAAVGAVGEGRVVRSGWFIGRGEVKWLRRAQKTIEERANAIQSTLFGK